MQFYTSFLLVRLESLLFREVVFCIHHFHISTLGNKPSLLLAEALQLMHPNSIAVTVPAFESKGLLAHVRLAV